MSRVSKASLYLLIDIPERLTNDISEQKSLPKEKGQGISRLMQTCTLVQLQLTLSLL